jgi:hypothetical protein
MKGHAPSLSFAGAASFFGLSGGSGLSRESVSGGRFAFRRLRKMISSAISASKKTRLKFVQKAQKYLEQLYSGLWGK